MQKINDQWKKLIVGDPQPYHCLLYTSDAADE